MEWDEALREMLQSKPASYLTMLNTICNVSNADLKHRAERQSTEANQQDAH